MHVKNCRAMCGGVITGSFQVSFNLAWGCDGVKDRHHKHDVVSFERGNITTAVRSNKQVSSNYTIVWFSRPCSSTTYSRYRSYISFAQLQFLLLQGDL